MTAADPDRPAPGAGEMGLEVLWVPPAWVLAHYRSSEGATWEETRADFAAHHTHLDALADDIARHGVRTPLQLHPAGRVLRGHHRLLTAHDVGTAVVPIVFAHLDERTSWDPRTRIDVPRDDLDADDEPWTDRIFAVPDAARRAAHPAPGAGSAARRDCGTMSPYPPSGHEPDPRGAAAC